MSAAGGARLSREDFKKQKAIDQARQAGTLPPEVDNEGNLINPHIPAFMSKAPWYLNAQEGSGLQHQKTNKKVVEYDGIQSWYKRGKDVFEKGKAPKIYRKGACRNCGAMTHKEKDCLERPRKVGAWKSGKNIGKDETKQLELKLSYDGSRDRWNGYDAVEQLKAIELYNKAEEERRKKAVKERAEKYRRQQELKEKKRADKKKLKQKKGEGKLEDESSEFDSSSSDENEEEDVDGVTLGDKGKLHQKMFTVGTAVKATVRNLRIREDTAKYLRNLDPNSAYYDPKSRSMRENPNPNVPLDELTYAGDNYVSMTGDAVEMAKAQVFSWEAHKLGQTKGHLQANPTQMQLEQKEFSARKKKLQEMKKKVVLDKYGGGEFMKKPDEAILNRGTDSYVEYTSDGRVVKGVEENPEIVPSRYEEDVYPGNHQSVWGSYFDKESFSWGYACCWQTTKQSYCTGEKGKEAKSKSIEMNLQNAKLPPKLEPGSTAVNRLKGYNPREQSDRYGDGAVKVDLDPRKLKEALERSNSTEQTDDKRKYNSSSNDYKVTAEDMEVYRRKKVKSEDPMSKLLSADKSYVIPQG